MINAAKIDEYTGILRRETKAKDILVLKKLYEAHKANMNRINEEIGYCSEEDWHWLFAYERILSPYGYVPRGNVWD